MSTYSIKATNVNEAFLQGLWWLRTAGVREDSRNGPVLVAPGPVVTEYAHPWERVLFLPQRDANHVFHLLEALWMLTGSDDVTPLIPFNSGIARYTEDGAHMHGAYGYRWFKYGGVFDQVREAISQLKADPGSRQVVISMWAPGADLTEFPYKDRPCLAGDTVLWSPEGDLPIAEVAAKFASGEVSRWPVYSVTEDTKELTISWASEVWKSGVKQTKKITFDDGSIIRATEDHRFYRRGASALSAVAVEVKDLRIGDRVLATRRWDGKKGHENIKRRLGENTSFANMRATHITYAELLWGVCPKGFEHHHINENKRDNRAENLQRLTPSEHSRLHRMGDKNPMRNLTPEQHASRAKKQSAAIKKTWAALTPEQRSARSRGLPLPDNHKIISIEDGELEDVYDFTVPGVHTALVGTGVVTHNCNTHIYFDCRGGKLNMTVCCRSNDMLWGAYGANVVHMSVLQEVIAAGVGVPMGCYRQFSNNFHLYTENEMVKSLLKTPPTSAHFDYYNSSKDIHVPLIGPGETVEEFLADCQTLIWEDTRVYRTNFVRTVADPLKYAYLARKAGEPYTMESILWCDWKLGFKEWCERRN